MAEKDLPMADPASALDLDIDDLSTEEIMAKIEALRATRWSDLERLAAGRARKSVNKSTGGAAGKTAGRLSAADELKELLGDDNPLLNALLAAKPKRARKKKA